jgi:hypothetical protein
MVRLFMYLHERQDESFNSSKLASTDAEALAAQHRQNKEATPAAASKQYVAVISSALLSDHAVCCVRCLIELFLTSALHLLSDKRRTWPRWKRPPLHQGNWTSQLH